MRQAVPLGCVVRVEADRRPMVRSGRAAQVWHLVPVSRLRPVVPLVQIAGDRVRGTAGRQIRRQESSSDADDPVDALTQQVGVAVVPGVLVDEVQHHQPERHVFLPPGGVSGHVQGCGFFLYPA
jgi:hypothetical protein